MAAGDFTFDAVSMSPTVAGPPMSRSPSSTRSVSVTSRVVADHSPEERSRVHEGSVGPFR